MYIIFKLKSRKGDGSIGAALVFDQLLLIRLSKKLLQVFGDGNGASPVPFHISASKTGWPEQIDRDILFKMR